MQDIAKFVYCFSALILSWSMQRVVKELIVNNECMLSMTQELLMV